MAPIMVIMSDNTLDKDTPGTRVCVFMHVEQCACVCALFTSVFLCMCFYSIQTAVFIRRFPSSPVGVVQVTEPSMSDPVYFSWLGCVSVLNLCWLSVTVLRTFTSALVNFRPNEIQIWELSQFRA